MGISTPPTFSSEIRPLFRPEDIEAMQAFFDLSSYEDVRNNAEVILERIEDGSMPCDEMWDQAKLETLRAWIDGGMLA